MSEIKFRNWLKKTYGIQDYNAYANTQTEEIAIRYAEELSPDLYELCKQQHEALKISRLEMRTAYSIIGGHSHNLDTIEQAIEAFNKLFK